MSLARALPTIFSGLTTGLLSGGINKAISGSGAAGGGLSLKHGDDISDGAGLLMGKNSPFNNIPVLEMYIKIKYSSFFSQSGIYSRTVWLMYLVAVLRAGREIYKW